MSEYTQLKEQMNEIDDLNARIRELEAAISKLKEALKEVVTISDRKHDAWDRAKALLVKS